MNTGATSAPTTIANYQARSATTIDTHIGNRIRLLRLSRGLSQERLGEAVGITFQQVQKYESGVNRISASRLYGLAQHLGVSFEYFFDGIANQETTALLDRGDTDIAKLLATREGVALIKAYSSLGDPRLQRAIVHFLTIVANRTTSQV
jgi:transcriptional regulator with XRE-family HTH domain